MPVSVPFRACLASVLLLAATLPAAAVQLAPHRATYALSLDGSKVAKRVNAASGQIVYELRGNQCAGYSVLLRQNTDLDTQGGLLSSSISTATWEDGTGKAYRFRVTNKVNGDAPEQADGVAERRDGTLVVKATKPEETTVKISGSVLLPTQHVLRVLAAATSGEPILQAPVYDGSPDARKVYDTLSVIGKGITDEQGLEQAAKSGELAGRTRYPVTISYYERGGKDQTPSYVISFDLFDNGVSRALKLDYGDFALRGTLISYEPLPTEACPN
ncbi:cell envelope integrity EipB family protein [Ancylobacter pratisalsi]|uniref:Cell envelope integrity EipB family protein n=1 Tax=Ancylobacter pratisalsi TaxID=1745854 RepID=A0A6P1YKK6_9HYPH|nr:cell envelope integrity EipB family protein [Ancylobacter pratisalsi]QIB32324.1 cell envelope integrity EipB family protein [Ancylobacter pratisalsi]